MAYNEKILDFGTRTNSLHTLSNKIQDSGYQSRNFYTQLRKIQDKVWEIKRSGLQNLDDHSLVVPNLKILFNRLLTNYNKAYELAEKITKDNKMLIEEIDMFIHCNSKPDSRITDVDIDINDLLEQNPINALSVRVYIRFKKITVNVTTSQNNIISSPEIGNIEINGDMPLFKNLNAHWNNINSNDFKKVLRPTVTVTAVNNDVYFRNHPFISSNYGNEGFANETHVCMGDLHADISNALWNHDIPTYLYLVVEWLSLYVINRTHPLNGINTMHFGHPNWITEEYENIMGVNNSQDCKLHEKNARMTKHLRDNIGSTPDEPMLNADLNSYCNNCIHIDTCKQYRDYNPSEDQEQLCWNYAVNYSTYTTKDAVRAEDVLIHNYRHAMNGNEKLLNPDMLMLHEMVYQKMYAHEEITELLEDYYKVYVEYNNKRPYLGNQLNLKIHVFVMTNLNNDLLMNLITPKGSKLRMVGGAYVSVKNTINELIDVINYNTTEWKVKLKFEIAEEWERQKKIDKQKAEKGKQIAITYKKYNRKEMENYMDNLMATGNVIESKTNRTGE